MSVHCVFAQGFFWLSGMDPFKVYLSNLPFALSSSVLSAALLHSGFVASNVIVFNKGRAAEARIASALVQFGSMDFCEAKVATPMSCSHWRYSWQNQFQFFEGLGLKSMVLVVERCSFLKAHCSKR